MTTQYNRAQFLQALKDHPEWRKEIHREILGEELLRPPIEFRAFVTEQRQFNAKVLQRFEEVDRRFEQINQRFEQIDQRFNNIHRRLNHMQDDNSILKSQNLENRASQLAVLLCAHLDQDFVRTLNAQELFRMTQDTLPSFMTRSERESFINADLVVEAEDNGATAYIAAEISFTGDLRDYHQARRNSGYLNQITGRPALAAIVSIRNENLTQELIDAGEIHWLQADI